MYIDRQMRLDINTKGTEMKKCRITVLKIPGKTEGVSDFCSKAVQDCPCCREGQIFTSEADKPSGFCMNAWDDLSKTMGVLRNSTFWGNDIKSVQHNTMITSCSNSVIFKLEAI